MLVTCPDCEQKVSDRAKSCPQCGYPIAEQLAEAQKKEELARDRASRRQAGEVDCIPCKATGFCTGEEKGADGKVRQQFWWCDVCEHTGRVHLCESDRGFFAVSRVALAEFLAGNRDDTDEHATFIGKTAPAQHRFSKAGQRHSDPGTEQS